MYNYQDLKPQVFLEENQKDFLKVRDTVKTLPMVFELQEAIKYIYGDVWLAIAYVDRLKELGEISELQTSEYTPAQNRMFKHY